MKARILTKSEENLWEKFIKNHPLATIHQTSKWGHFQENIPSRGNYYIVVLEEDKKIIGGTMIIRHLLPKGHSWFYAARGPLLDYKSKDLKDQISTITKALKKLAKKEKAIFLRIDPPRKKSKKFPKLKGFSPVPYGFQPEHTLILDLKKSEKTLLSEMKPKGRYNIRLAEKKGVTIRKSDPLKPKQFLPDMQDFYAILEETTKRDKFSGHNMGYYINMLESLNENATLYLAEYNNKVIAGIIVTYFNETATYYYGVSSNEYRNLMAPYLLQWHAIQESKEQGFAHYDFFGISPPNSKNHPWRGVTEFKKKFGGHETSYHPARQYSFSLILHTLYKVYKRIKIW